MPTKFVTAETPAPPLMVNRPDVSQVSWASVLGEAGPVKISWPTTFVVSVPDQIPKTLLLAFPAYSKRRVGKMAAAVGSTADHIPVDCWSVVALTPPNIVFRMVCRSVPGPSGEGIVTEPVGCSQD